MFSRSQFSYYRGLTSFSIFFLAILKFLQDLSTNVLKEEPQKLEDPQVKYFVCATIRILGAWLSEETQASYSFKIFSMSWT